MSAPNVNVSHSICDFPAPFTLPTGQLLVWGRLRNMGVVAEPASLAGYSSERRILNRGRFPQLRCPVSPRKREAALLTRVHAMLKLSVPSLAKEGVSHGPLPCDSHKRPFASRRFDSGDADCK